MSFCIHCGAQLPDEAKFCFQCGKPVTVVQAGEPMENEININESIIEAKPETGVVKIIRANEFLPIYDCRLFIDEKELCSLECKEGAEVSLPFGEHTITLLLGYTIIATKRFLVEEGKETILPFEVLTVSSGAFLNEDAELPEISFRKIPAWNKQEKRLETSAIQQSEKPSTLKIIRPYNQWYNRSCIVNLDGKEIAKLSNNRFVEQSVSPGNHTISIFLFGKQIGSCEIIVNEGEEKAICLNILQNGEQCTFEEKDDLDANIVDISKTLSNTGNVCPNCGGIMTFQTVSEREELGCGMILLCILLAATVVGLIILLLILRKKTVTYAVCQSCGYRKKVNYPGG